jgi:DNA segregation ATPase FtsK/SpoIIIE, S-DNA-T family
MPKPLFLPRRAPEAPGTTPPRTFAHAAVRGREAAALLLGASSLFVALAIASFEANPANPDVHGANWVGPVGASVAGALVGAVGVVAWTLVLELALLAWPLLRGHASKGTLARLAGDLLIVLIASSLVHVAAPDARAFGALAAGGSLGELFGELLRSLFSTVGSFLVGLTAVGLILIGRSSLSLTAWLEEARRFATRAAQMLVTYARALAALVRRWMATPVEVGVMATEPSVASFDHDAATWAREGSWGRETSTPAPSDAAPKADPAAPPPAVAPADPSPRRSRSRARDGQPDPQPAPPTLAAVPHLGRAARVAPATPSDADAQRSVADERPLPLPVIHSGEGVAKSAPALPRVVGEPTPETPTADPPAPLRRTASPTSEPQGSLRPGPKKADKAPALDKKADASFDDDAATAERAALPPVHSEPSFLSTETPAPLNAQAPIRIIAMKSGAPSANPGPKPATAASDAGRTSGAASIDPGSKTNAPSIGPGSKANAPSIDAGSKTNAPSIGPGSKANSPSIDAGSKASAPSIDPGPKPGVPFAFDDEPESLPSVNGRPSRGDGAARRPARGRSEELAHDDGSSSTSGRPLSDENETDTPDVNAGFAANAPTRGAVVARAAAERRPAPEAKAPEARTPEARAPKATAFDTKTSEPKPEARAPEARSVEARAVETRAPEARAVETRAPEARAVEVRASEARTPEARSNPKAFEARAPETGTFEAKSSDARTPGAKAFEDEAAEAKASEARAPEAKAFAPKTVEPKAETRSFEARAPEARAVEAKAPEARYSEARTVEARAPEARTPEARAPEARALEARVSEGRAPNVRAPEARPLEIRTPEAKAPPAKVPDRVVPAWGQGFRLPSTSLLEPAPESTPREEPEALLARARELEKVLANYGVKGAVADIHTGPTVSTFEVVPAEGTKVSKVASLDDDLALGLSCTVRIIAPIPGKSRIGFELPNRERIPVNLRELVEDRRYLDMNAPLPVVLGRDIVGAPFYADLASMPHVIVAGATGAGKSVGLNVMLTSLLTRRGPDELRMLMIDPKVVELAPFDRIPHMLLPVVTDMKQAATALKWAVDEMERRYQLFANAGTKNIGTYNGWVAKARRGEVKAYRPSQPVSMTTDEGTLVELGPGREPPPLPEPLPFIVIVVDEFADLMMQQGKDVEASVARLAQKARAAGMHVILATQRPSVDVITGMIKANFPTRVAFRVAQRVDSRTILDEQGAEHLLGRGDMLVKLNGTNETRRVQCPFISEEEVQRVTDFLRAQGEPVYDENILKPRDDDEGSADDDDGELDPKYDEAARVVAETRRCSTSWLQRKLGLGYNRAAKIVEAMEKRGLVGPANGARDREVLIDPI